MKPKYIVILVLVLLAAGLVFWYWQKNQPKPAVFAPNNSQLQTGQGLGAQVYQQQQNPVKNQVPDPNPINNSYTNPFQ